MSDHQGLLRWGKKTFRKNIWWKTSKMVSLFSWVNQKNITEMDIFGYPVASPLIRWPVWKLSDCFDHKSGVQKNNINYDHNFVMIQCTNHTELANIGFCLDDLDGNLATELDIVTKWTITMTYFELCLVIMNHLQFCFGEIFAFAVWISYFIASQRSHVAAHLQPYRLSENMHRKRYGLSLFLLLFPYFPMVFPAYRGQYSVHVQLLPSTIGPQRAGGAHSISALRWGHGAKGEHGPQPHVSEHRGSRGWKMVDLWGLKWFKSILWSLYWDDNQTTVICSSNIGWMIDISIMWRINVSVNDW